MSEQTASDDMLTLADAERLYGVKRATLYRYVQRGALRTYRRAMDRCTYVRRQDLEALRSFRSATVQDRGGPRLAAVEEARAFQERVFGGRVLATPTADLIEQDRAARMTELP